MEIRLLSYLGAGGIDLETVRKFLCVALVLIFACPVISGCGTMEGNMIGGTLLGAGLGAAIGSATGNPAAGAAIGAASGLVGGTITGLAQEDANRRYAYAQQMAPPPPAGVYRNQPFFDYNDRLWKCYDGQGRMLIWQFSPQSGWAWY